ncbi:MAG: hypothetical protein PVS2B2_25800 [Candidatus Acidiferrum sp.]
MEERGTGMTRVILVGAGKGGKSLLELFHKDPTVEIVGVADRDEKLRGWPWLANSAYQ